MKRLPPMAARHRRQLLIQSLEHRHLLAAEPFGTNALQPLDVTRDGVVAPLDALRVINAIERTAGSGSTSADPADSPGSFIDVNGDGRGTPLDALQVINALSRQQPIVAALLPNDSAPNGTTNLDLLTNDYGLRLQVNVTGLGNRTVEMRINGDGDEPYLDITEFFQDNVAVLDAGAIAQLNGAPLADGDHLFEIVVGANQLQFTISVDQTPPTLPLQISSDTDTGELGDGQTSRDLVTILGQNTAGEVASLVNTGSQTTSDENGQFVFYGVPLELGQNVLTITVDEFDDAGNAALGTLELMRTPREGWSVLSTEDEFLDELSSVVDLQSVSGSRKLRFGIETDFDLSDTSSLLEDRLLVYLVDPANPSQTILDRGINGTALFSLTNETAEFSPGLVTFDGTNLEIDVTDIQGFNQGLLVIQLLNTDSDSGTSVAVSPIENTIVPSGSGQPRFPAIPAALSAGPTIDLTSFFASSSLAAELNNVRFDSTSGIFEADLTVHNHGTAVANDIAVSFSGLPSGVSLINRSGVTNNGLPYLNLNAALPMGGLRPGTTSEPVAVRIENLQRTQFDLSAFVLATNNAPPQFDPLDPVVMLPGQYREIQLSAVDPDGDMVTYQLESTLQSMPSGMLRGDGTLVLRPRPGQQGSYTVVVSATDGAARATQTLSIEVQADPVTTTRVSGVILTTESVPLQNVPISIGSALALTGADGKFEIEIEGALANDTLRVFGNELTLSEQYPFVAEKLPLVLEHEVFIGAKNEIGRPIFLPALDMTSAASIDPMQDTTVTSNLIPGAEVFVAAGTLRGQSGEPFSGQLTITEVPRDLTPAALPQGMRPDMVVTIQPGEMSFTTPAPLSLPNLAGFAPGTVMDLWSINPATGEFDNVGKGRVSADGSVIDTISGGIRNSSWHYFSPPPGSGGGGGGGGPCNNQCKASGSGNSSFIFESGAMMETHELVTYSSLGESRAVTLTYDSHAADARPIIRFWFDDVPAWVTRGEDVHMFASLVISRGDFEYQLPGLSMDDSTRPGGEHVWQVPMGGGGVEAALQADFSTQPTGFYDYQVQAGFRGGRAGAGGSIPITGKFIHINQRSSVFGVGWGIAGLQEIIENPDGSVLLVDQGGDAVTFNPPEGNSNVYPSVAGDFSVLEKDSNGNFRRTMKDRTIYQFDSQNRIATMHDRNGNLTEYIYNEFGIAKIVDPVGLETAFNYQNGRVSSIVDPAGRVTQLSHDSEGNLVRVTDPDGTSRQWGYDADHHMVSEIDKRGFSETTTFGFHGRVEQGIRKDGSVVQLAAYQTQGLYRPEQTMNANNPPMALSRGSVAAVFTDGNGNTARYTLDGLGQLVSATDGLGSQGTTDRNENNLVAVETDARGNETFYTYDDRGNVLTIRDAFTPSADPAPAVDTVLQAEEMPYYRSAKSTQPLAPERVTVSTDWTAGIRRLTPVTPVHENKSTPPLIIAGTLADDVVRWVGPNGGDWSTADNWSTGRVPGVNDFVAISSGASLVHSSGATRVAGLFVGGSLQVEGGSSITITAAFAVVGILDVIEGSRLETTAPTEIDSADIRVASAGALVLPAATTFTSGKLTLSGKSTTVDLPNLRNIDDSQFVLSGGAQFSVAATSYSSTQIGSSQTLFSATGSGTSLDLSSIQSINAQWNDNWGGTQVHTIQAEDGATINLSGVQRITSPARTEDRLDLVVDSTSTLDLSSLRSTNGAGQTQFSFIAPSIMLPALEFAGNTTFLLTGNSTLSLPILKSWEGGTISVPTGGAFNLPELKSVVSVAMSIGTNGQLNAPKLISFTHSRLDLGASQTLNAPEFETIDNSRFSLSGGAHLSVAATSYSATGLSSSQTLFSSTGFGTLLDLSSVLNIDDSWDDSWGGTQIHSIKVEDGAIIDLSGVQTITSPVRTEDRLVLVADSTSTINLSSLRSTIGTGQTQLDFIAPVATLPALESAANTTFTLADNSTLTLPMLGSWSGGSINVPTGGVFNLSELQSVNDVSMTIGTNGQLNAPKLVSFTHSRLELGSNQALNAPAFQTIDNSRFYLSGGAQMSVAAQSYSAAGLGSSQTLFSASGNGTVLDLSSIQSIDDRWDDSWGGTQVHTIDVTNGATIDLSGVQTIITPARIEDRLDLAADATGTLDLSSLRATRGTGETRFEFSASVVTISALESVTNATFLMADNTTLNLPILANWSGGSIAVPTEGSISLPELLSANGVSVTIGTNGILTAPKLVSFTHSRLDLGASQTLNVPGFQTIDNSRIFLTGGAQFSVAATSYSASELESSQTLFSASGTGTVLDLSSVQSFDDRWDDSWGGSQVHTIKAMAGATIDLSGVHTITSPARTEDVLDLMVDASATLDLSSLRGTTGTGQVYFDMLAPTVTLQAIESARNASFILADNATLNLPNLVSWNGGSINVPDGGEFSFPELLSVNGVHLTIGANGVLNAPKLVSFTDSRLDLGSNQALNVPRFALIDNSRFFLTDGAQFSVGATSYSATQLDSSQILFSATGTGTLLDLSSLQSIDDRWDDSWGGTQVHTIQAEAGATIDLLNVITLTGPTRGEDRLDIVTRDGGSIDLTSLLSRSANVNIVLNAAAPIPEALFSAVLLPPLQNDVPLVAATGRQAITEAIGEEIAWIGAVSGDWSNPSNWDARRVPGRFDTVTINVVDEDVSIFVDVDVELAGLASTESLVISSGRTLTLHGESTIGGNFVAQSGSTLIVEGPGITFTATAKVEINGANIQALSGASIAFPMATSFQNGVLTVDGLGVVTTPLLGNIDNSRFILSGGAQFSAVATSYSATELSSSQTLFSVSGVGTVLDLSSLQSLDNRWDDSWGGSQVHTIQANDGGTINLSMVRTIASPVREEDRLDFTTDNGGAINLSSLISITSASGQVHFNIDRGDFTLINVESLQNTTFNLEVGTTLQLPELLTWDRGTVNVPTGGTFDLPKLHTANRVTIGIGSGGTMAAGALDTFTYSTLSLGANQTFNAPQFTNIDNSRFFLTGGKQLAVAATTYSSSGLEASQTLFSVSGTGTLLDLSSLQSIDDQWDDSWGGSQVHTIQARDGGTINLSAVSSITAPFRAEDRLELIAERSGAINLSGLIGTASTSGQIHLNVDRGDLTLTNLETLQNTTFNLQIGTTLQLPKLLTWDGGSVSVPIGGSFDLPKLHTANAVSIGIGSGGTLAAGVLENFTNSVLSLGANQTLAAPRFTTIDNSRFFLYGGAQFSVAATSYSGTGLGSSQTLFSAIGANTLLDLSSLQNINDRWDDGWGGTQVHVIQATNGGTINLSAVTTITAPVRAEDRLELNVESGGEINLSGLNNTLSSNGQINLNIDRGDLTLINVQSLQNTTFNLQAGTTLQLPELLNWDRGGVNVPIGGTYNLPKLHTANEVNISIGSGGTLAAGVLETFTGSILSLGANQTLAAPQFTNVDNSRFFLSGGVQFSVAATSYSATGLGSSQTLFSATGAGTILDLSSLQNINDRWDDGWGGGQVHTIHAKDGGTINLSAVSTINAPVRAEDRLDLTVESGGVINLAGLTSTASANGQVNFNVDRGNLTLTNLESLQNTTFSLQVGTTLQLPELLTWDRGNIYVPIGGTFDLPKLHTVHRVGIELGSGGTLSAGVLQTFTNSLLTLGADQMLVTPEFTNIDNSRFSLSGGAQFSVAATSYSATGIGTSETLFSATGVGTLLDLSSLQSVNDGWNDGWNGSQIHTIKADTGATIDLSNALEVTGPTRFEDRLQFVADTLGVIQLAAGTTLNAGFVRIAGTGETRGMVVSDRLEVGVNATLELGGIVDSNIFNGGRILLLDSPDQVKVDGNFTQLESGRLDIAINGFEAGTEYDQFIVTGVASLDGRLSISRSGSFVPASVVQSFTVLQAASREGRFATATGLELPGGDQMAVTYRNDRVVVRRQATDDDGLLTYGLDALPIDIASGDLDGDGLADFVVADRSQIPNSNDVQYNLTLFYGDGNLDFSNVVALPLDSEVSAVQFSDINGDGRADIITAHPTNNTLEIRLGNESDSFDEPSTVALSGSPFNIVLEDMNGDNALDIVVATTRSTTVGAVTVLTNPNNGSANFTVTADQVVPGALTAIGIGDVFGSSALDVAVAYQVANVGHIGVLVGNGTGGLAGSGVDRTIGANPSAIAVGDIDGDGDSDVIVAARTLAVDSIFGEDAFDLTVFKSDAVGDLIQDHTIAQDGAVTDLAFADMDSDGDEDLISVTDRSLYDVARSGLSLRMNNGEGRFITNRAIHIGEGPSFLGLTYLDGDSKIDIVTADSGLGTLTVAPGATLLSASVGPKRYTYDAIFGDSTSSTDELGRRTLFDIDPRTGNVLSTTRVVGLLGGDDDVITQSIYNNFGLITTEIDPLGRIQRNDYDEYGRLTKVTFAVGTIDEASQQFEYDAAGNQTATIDENGNRTEYEYDAINRQTVRRDALLNETLYQYDANGNVVAVTDARGNNIVKVYDSRDRLIREINQLGFETNHSYDENGNLISTVDPLGRETLYTFDARGRLSSELPASENQRYFYYDANDVNTATSESSGITTYRILDSRGRISVEIDSLGRSQEYTYDPADKLVQTIDKSGNATSYEYDELDRLTSLVNSLGNTISYVYNKNSHVTEEIRETGERIQITYDNRDRIIRTTDQIGSQTHYEYNATGKLTKHTDPNGNQTTFLYDAIDRTTTTIDPNGQPEHTTYDANGNITSKSSRSGLRTLYEYDQANRRTSEKWLDGDVESNFAVYEYDRANNILLLSDFFSRLSIQYDEANRFTTISNFGTPNAPETLLHYAYDISGNIVSVTDNISSHPQATTTYAYDALNRVTDISLSTNNDSPPLITHFSYNTLGDFSQIRRFRDEQSGYTPLDTFFSYDALGRITEIAHTRSESQNLMTFELEYDHGDRITQFSSDETTTNYLYDARDYLISSQSGEDLRTFDYDDSGNRISPAIEIGQGNRLLTDDTYIYNYNYDGSLIRRTNKTDGTFQTYQWDHRRRLLSTENFGADSNLLTRIAFTYDLLNRRISKTVSENSGESEHVVSSTSYVYDRNAVILDSVASESPSRQYSIRYLHGPKVDQIIAEQQSDGTVHWYLADHIGTVRALANLDGDVVNRIDYDDFGHVVAQSNPETSTRFLYTGRELDLETGLYYYRARYYEPRIGRFISEDPIGIMGGPNYYSYVDNSPIGFTDPTGMIRDKFGRQILSHWLDGSGSTLTFSEGAWGAYMKANTLLPPQIKRELFAIVGESEGSSSFHRRFHAEIQNGYFTGYQMLHGSEGSVGDFEIFGTLKVTKDCDCTKYAFNVTFRWNDIIDPNRGYWSDILLSGTLNLVFSPKDYNIHIQWAGTPTIEFCDGKVTKRGYPF